MPRTAGSIASTAADLDELAVVEVRLPSAPHHHAPRPG